MLLDLLLKDNTRGACKTSDSPEGLHYRPHREHPHDPFASSTGWKETWTAKKSLWRAPNRIECQSHVVNLCPTVPDDTSVNEKAKKNNSGYHFHRGLSNAGSMEMLFLLVDRPIDPRRSTGEGLE